VPTSEPIPSKGTDADKDKNPPHRQAANYYKEDVLERFTPALHTIRLVGTSPGCPAR
jgi:hypothetical protein